LKNNAYGGFETGFEINGNVATLHTKLTTYGEWKIEYLCFENTNGKSIMIYNTAIDENKWKFGIDMSLTDVLIKNDPKDNLPPEIDVSSIKIEKSNMLISERNTLSLKITDNDKIEFASLCIKAPDGSTCGYSATKKEDGLYYFEYISGDLIGNYQVEYIYVGDKSGNTTKIENSNIYNYASDAILLDLSNLDFCIETNSKEEKKCTDNKCRVF
jgi:hypothetical protein